jgi:H(+)-transporting ATP synthase subunit D
MGSPPPDRGERMSATTLPATRLNLLRSRRRLDRLTRGAALLRRKREALVSELFRVARPAADARALIAAAAHEAYPALLDALARDGITGLRPTAWPVRDYRVEVEARTVWGAAVSRIVSRPPVVRTLADRGTASPATGAVLIDAASRFERLTELLLEAASQEMLLRRLGEALAQTSRQVHTLERRVSPQVERDIARVRRVLDERERDERLRLSRLLNRRPSRG